MARWPLPAHDWDWKRAPDWPEKKAWLLSLGMSDDTIRGYRLDRYPYMDNDAWLCMIQEALRHYTRLHNEQQRRKRNART